MKTSMICIGGVIACGFASVSQANVLTWVDRQSTISASIQGGDLVNGVNSWSDSTNTTVAPFPFPDAGGHILNVGGFSYQQTSNYWYSTLSNGTPGQGIGGLSFNYGAFGYNTNRAGGLVDTSTRQFTKLVTADYVFTVPVAFEFFLQTRFTEHGTLSNTVIESGSFSGGLFSPSGSSLDLLTMTLGSSTVLPAGDYRYRMTYSMSFSASEAFSYNDGMTFYMYTIPTQSAAGILAIGGLLAARRRR
jgi:hypothetical protein